MRRARHLANPISLVNTAAEQSLTFLARLNKYKPCAPRD